MYAEHYRSGGSETWLFFFDGGQKKVNWSSDEIRVDGCTEKFGSIRWPHYSAGIAPKQHWCTWQCAKQSTNPSIATAFLSNLLVDEIWYIDAVDRRLAATTINNWPWTLLNSIVGYHLPNVDRFFLFTNRPMQHPGNVQITEAIPSLISYYN